MDMLPASRERQAGQTRAAGPWGSAAPAGQPAAAGQPRIIAAPKIRQLYWCDFWCDAQLPEMWKTRPVIVVSYRAMATIQVKSSHISGGSPPILGSGLGPAGSDQGMRKTEGNLVVCEEDTARCLDHQETRSGIQHASARWSAPFPVGNVQGFGADRRHGPSPSSVTWR